MDTQLWAIAIKAGSRKGDVADKKAALKKATEGTAAMVEEFELPIAELRVGTMDSLMSLGDDLNKMDMLADATTTKLFKQLDEIGKELDKEAGLPGKDIPAEVSGSAPDAEHGLPLAPSSHAEQTSWTGSQYRSVNM